jgi:hypothetical protein
VITAVHYIRAGKHVGHSFLIMLNKPRISEFLHRQSRWPTSGLLLLSLLSASAADSAKTDNTWKYDLVYLKSGNVLKGLIDREDENSIHLRWVVQKPGEPTLIIDTPIARHEIKENGIKPLADPKEREILKARINALDPATERQIIEQLALEPAPWGKDSRGAWSYSSAHFQLISNASKEIVRPAAFRLKQIYAAYGRYLPPRHRTAQSTRIYLYKTMSEYQQELKRQGRTVLNPALYDPVRNEILCASDLERLDEELKKYRKEHQQRLERLREQMDEWRKIYNGKLPQKLTEELNADWQKIKAAERANDKVFEKATERLFQTLYHESFHAYLAKFVYRPEEATVPRWLNEGLAQIFESAIVEAGELRVGHADPVRLAQARESLRSGSLITVDELLRSGPDQFLVGHANDQALSDRHYLTSWAVAFYLTFGLDKLRSPEMTRYVQALKKGTDPAKAFSDLVGRPPEDFENAFHDYLRWLQPSGRTARPVKEPAPIPKHQ